ncbi:MAG: glycosyltransferase family 4 protein [Gammaproteobacteria bacterium]
MKLLTFSTLYPNSERPQHGIFVETRLRHLLASGSAQSRVVAPVPWFPLGHPRFGYYAACARVPTEEERHGISILHPRYPLIPKFGMSSAPAMLAATTISTLKKVLRSGYEFDVIDAHYFYPDGVAAVLLGKMLSKPVTITARGTDINLIPRYRLPRQMMRWAAHHAAGIIAVCQALKDAIVALGIPENKVTVLRNGVDLELFHPLPRDVERKRLGLTKPSLLCVGHLTERKGHDIAIRAITKLPEYDLMIVGEGEEEERLKALSLSLGVADRVRFLGAIPQPELKRFYSAADALVLCSSREGWANVLLEAMACGTPVVATGVWGTPEIVASPEAGVLMQERSPRSLVTSVRALFANCPGRSATRHYAEQFGWESTTRGQLELFSEILESTPTHSKCLSI